MNMEPFLSLPDLLRNLKKKSSQFPQMILKERSLESNDFLGAPAPSWKALMICLCLYRFSAVEGLKHPFMHCFNQEQSRNSQTYEMSFQQEACAFQKAWPVFCGLKNQMQRFDVTETYCKYIKIRLLLPRKKRSCIWFTT